MNVCSCLTPSCPTAEQRRARRLAPNGFPGRGGDRRTLAGGRQHPAQRRRMLTSSAGSVAEQDARCPTCCPTAARPAARPETRHSLGCPTCPTYLGMERLFLLPVKAGDWAVLATASIASLPQNWSGRSGSWLKSRSSRRPRSGSRSGSARPARLDQSASPSSNAPLTT
jgi:hypothetical protein